MSAIRGLFPDGNIVSEFDGQCTFRLPMNIRVSDVFETVQEQAEKSGITDWSVGQVGLEQVFGSIVRSYPA